MSRICDISGKRANNANRVSFSNKHWARWQYPNLQSKKLYSKELDRYVRVKVATSTLRTIRKLGLDETAKKVRDRERRFFACWHWRADGFFSAPLFAC
jgi:large subunit ribosomal protein L28